MAVLGGFPGKKPDIRVKTGNPGNQEIFGSGFGPGQFVGTTLPALGIDFGVDCWQFY